METGASDVNILKRPFGTLVADKEVTREKIESLLEGVSKIITVGDATTERILSFGITPDLAVTDDIERRSTRGRPIDYQAREMFCTNPAGTIASEAVEVLRKALEGPSPVRIRVQGEEDLLALPLFVMAPMGSVVLYGQPLEGIVLVSITEQKQNQAKHLMTTIFGNTV